MNVPFFIARRYFFSKQEKKFINIISWLSLSGVAFVSAAIIIVLSVFNGLEDLLRSLNNSFDPALKIEATKGKTFILSPTLIESIQAIPGVSIVTEVIEDYAYVRYRQAEMVVTIKGVSENFIDQHRLDDHITEGKLALTKYGTPFAIIGRGVRYMLSVEVTDEMTALQMFYIKDLKYSTFSSSKFYVQKDIRPGAVFSIEKNFDENFIFVPLPFAQALLDYGNRRTSLEVMTDGSDLKKVRERLKKKLGKLFSVHTNEEQHQDLYRLIKIERLFIFMSLSFLLLVGSLNTFFSLIMLFTDKKKDISILIALGASPKTIQWIFLFEGAIISFVGATVGIFIGAVLCLLQQQVGLVGMGIENAIVDHYPITLKLVDFLWTALVVIVITLLISYRPACLAAKSYDIQLL